MWEEAHERLPINALLAQLHQPQILFSVTQKQPASLDDTVAVTLKMESYFLLHTQPINGTLPSPEECVVARIDAIDKVAQPLVLFRSSYNIEMVVVSPLMSEAILGIDFLEEQQARFDLGQGRLCLTLGVTYHMIHQPPFSRV